MPYRALNLRRWAIIITDRLKLQEWATGHRQRITQENSSVDEIARHTTLKHYVLLARDVIYTSRAYATILVSVCLSVCLSVTEVHWRIIANLRFKFRSKFTAHCRRGEGSSQQQHFALCWPLLGPLVFKVLVNSTP